MTAERLLQLLDQFESRLVGIAGQVKDAKDRAQNALDSLESLRQEIGQIKKQTMALAVTVIAPPGTAPREAK